MTETEVPPEKSFVLQKNVSDASHVPLEVHHLAHDLRSPLNSVLGFSELLVAGIEGPLNEIQLEDIKAIHQSAKTLLHLINTVVDLSKLEANQFRPNLEPVDLNKLVAKLLSTELDSAPSNPIKISADIPETAPLMWVDSHRVKQMLQLLIDFSLTIKHTSHIKISTAHDRQQASIKISVVGGTLSAVEKSTLFDLRVKIDANNRTRLGRGGIELPLVQKLAQAQGGNAWVENDNSIDTTFFLHLPLLQAN